VVVSWEAPYDNSETIVAYEVVFRQQDGAYSEIAECDASLQQIVDELQCLISMSTLRLAPFNLSFD